MSDRIKIAIADDHFIIVESLFNTLSKILPCDVLIKAPNGKELIKALSVKEVDIILLDINMPVMDGMEALRIIKQENPNQKVIILSMYDDEGLMLSLVKLKANAVLSKSVSTEELKRAILEVYRSGRYFAPRMMEIIYNKAADINGSGHSISTNGYAIINDIDRNILKLMCKELTSKEIADQLCLSFRTIEGRRKRMIRNLGVRNQAGLILYAVRKGIYRP